MALRQLLLGRRIDEQRARKAALETAREALAARRTDMRRREAELEASIGEVTEQTPPEDRDALDALTAEYEADEAALSDEEAQNARDREQVEAEIIRLQAELDALNARAQGGAAGTSATGIAPRNTLAVRHRKHTQKKILQGVTCRIRPYCIR